MAMVESTPSPTQRQLEANLAVLYKTAPHQEIFLAEYTAKEYKISWDKPQGVPVDVTRIIVVLKDYVAGVSNVVLTRPFESHVSRAEMERALLKDTGDLLQKLFGEAVHKSSPTGIATGMPGATEVKLQFK